MFSMVPGAAVVFRELRRQRVEIIGLHSLRAVGLRQFLLRKLARSIRSFGSLRIPVSRRSGVYYVGEVLLKVVQRTLIVRVSDDTGLGRLRGLRLSIPVLRDFLDALSRRLLRQHFRE